MRRPPGAWYVLDFARGRPSSPFGNPTRDTGRLRRPPVSFRLPRPATRGAALKRRSLLLAAAGLPSFGLAPLAHAASAVRAVQEGPSAGHGIRHLARVVSPHAVKAGEVVFKVRNISKGPSHEVLVVKPPLTLSEMPYSTKQNRLVQSKIDKRADSDNQKPGQAYTRKVDLKPEKYLLVRNKPGHYRAGMYTWLTVTH